MTHDDYKARANQDIEVTREVSVKLLEKKQVQYSYGKLFNAFERNPFAQQHPQEFADFISILIKTHQQTKYIIERYSK